MAPRFRRSRAGLDFRGAQTSDVTTGDHAGGNIYHRDPDAWAFVKDYLFRLDQGRAARDDELRAEIAAACEALEVLDREFSIYQRFVSNRFDADVRRAAVDRMIAVAAIVIALAALGLHLL